MQQIIIIGNVVRDPELRKTSSGISVCSFTIATNNKEKVDYFRCNAWRGLAEVTAKYLKKGSKAAVVGTVTLNTYTANDGQSKSSLEVNAYEVEFLSPRDERKQETADERAGFVEVTDPDSDLPF